MFDELKMGAAVDGTVLEPAKQKLRREAMQVRRMQTVDEVVEQKCPVGTPHAGK